MAEKGGTEMKKRIKTRRFMPCVYVTLQIVVILVISALVVGITYLIASSGLPLWLKFLLLK
jgi:hypothetical protein